MLIIYKNMGHLKQDIYKFVEALNKNQSVYLNRHGFWHVENPFKCWSRKTLGLEASAKIEFASMFLSHFDQLEEIPILFPGKSNDSDPIGRFSCLSHCCSVCRK